LPQCQNPCSLPEILFLFLWDIILSISRSPFVIYIQLHILEVISR
jgi:hypothetical protein